MYSCAQSEESQILYSQAFWLKAILPNFSVLTREKKDFTCVFAYLVDCFRTTTRCVQPLCVAMLLSRRNAKIRNTKIAARLAQLQRSVVSVSLRCEVSYEPTPLSALVHIPCCNYSTHTLGVDDGMEAMCPYCSTDLRELGVLQSPNDQLPCVARERRDHVSVEWFERLPHQQSALAAIVRWAWTQNLPIRVQILWLFLLVSPPHQLGMSSSVVTWAPARIVNIGGSTHGMVSTLDFRRLVLNGSIVKNAEQWVSRLAFQGFHVLVAGCNAQCSSPIARRGFLECGVPIANSALGVRMPCLVFKILHGPTTSPTDLFPRLAICTVGEQLQDLLRV